MSSQQSAETHHKLVSHIFKSGLRQRIAASQMRLPDRGIRSAPTNDRQKKCRTFDGCGNHESTSRDDHLPYLRTKACSKRTRLRISLVCVPILRHQRCALKKSRGMQTAIHLEVSETSAMRYHVWNSHQHRHRRWLKPEDRCAIR